MLGAGNGKKERRPVPEALNRVLNVARTLSQRDSAPAPLDPLHSNSGLTAHADKKYVHQSAAIVCVWH